MPAYYKPHPALIYVQPDEFRGRYTCCSTEIWTRIDEILKTTTISKTSAPVLPKPRILPTEMLESGKVMLDSTRPETTTIVIQTQEASATIELYKPESIGHGNYGKILALNGNIFSTAPVGEDVPYEKADPYLFLFGYCYGGGTIPGLHVIDTARLLFYTVTPAYHGNCEGGNGFQFNPVNQYFMENITLINLPTGERVQVCGGNGFVRSYDWSGEGGRYLYMACGGRSSSDQLRRYDIQTHEEVVLTDPNLITFKAVALDVSADQNHIAFIWNVSDFVPIEPYGVWVIDLTR